MKRSRLVYFSLTLGVVAAGLFSRSAQATFLPAWVTTHAGDVLWALMVYLLTGTLLPGSQTWRVALISLTDRKSVV